MENQKEKIPDKENVGLKREIGLVSAVNFLINIIIGSGIFITPGKLLAECGSVGMMFSLWALCGLISFMTCLPFGELSTVVPKSGSMYIYMLTAFNSYHPFYGALPAFTFFWFTYLIVQPCNSALSAILFAEYFFVILHMFMSEVIICNETVFKYILGAGALVLIGVINCISVKLYVISQDILTYVKMGSIIFIIGCGAYMTLTGEAKEYDSGFSGTHLSVRQLTQALYYGLFSFDGGWAITGITEEIKNPERNIVCSISIALMITTATYLLLNLTFLTALTPAEISNGTTVIADFAKALFGLSGGAIAAGIICLCLLTSIMSGVFYSSRIGYVAAREGHVIEAVGYIHKTFRTPAPAVVSQILLSLFYFFVGGDISLLIEMCSFFSWIAYGFTMIAVFILRIKLPDAYRPFRVPSAIPVIVAAVSCFLVVNTILLTQAFLLIAFAVCLTVIIFLYYIFIYKAIRVKYLDKIQKQIQSSLALVPPPEQPSL